MAPKKGKEPLPPIEPCGPRDVASFAALDLALRAHKDLAREGANILNAKALAKLVDGIRTFQDAHLGKQQKSQYWPLVRIPDAIFRDRSRSGPLSTALLSAYRHKASSSWRNFDFASPKRFDDNVALLRRLEKDLTAAGFLRRPAIYMDATVPTERKADLVGTVEKFGGTVVTDVKQATHVVAFDPEIDLEDNVAEEERRDREGEDMDKLYLRTVAVVQPSASEEKVDAPAHAKALVHWWYWPASYDEWMDANDVAGESETEPPSGPPGGPWCVGCKFIRDVARYNEWGVEADYAIADYQSKVDAYRGEEVKSKVNTKKKKPSRASAGGKKGKGTVASKIEAEAVTPKTSKNAADNPRKALSPALKGTATAGSGSSSGKRDRRSTGLGMNPRRIATGLYGTRGESIRRTVYDGALRIPLSASTIVSDALLDLFGGETDIAARQMTPGTLPGVDGIVRPSMDASLGPTITVTELNAAPSVCGPSAVTRTVAVNRKIPVLVTVGEMAQRIRGGGGNGEGGSSDDVAGHEHGYDLEKLSSALRAPDANVTESLSPVKPPFEGGQIGRDDSAEPHVESTAQHTLAAEETLPQGEGGPQKTSDGRASGIHDPLLGGNACPSADPETKSPFPPAKTTQSQEMQARDPGQQITTTDGTLPVPNIDESSSVNATPEVVNAGTADVPSSTRDKPPPEAMEGVSNLTSSVLTTVASDLGHRTIEKSLPLKPDASSAPDLPPAVSATSLTVSKGASDFTAGSHPSQPSESLKQVAAGTTNKELQPSIVASSVSAPKVQTSKVESKGEGHSSPVKNNAPKSGTTPKIVEAAQIVPLPKRPPQQPSVSSVPPSSVPPGSAPPPGMEEQTTVAVPSWYKAKEPSDLETCMLPEWFDGSAAHRTPSTYIKAREDIIRIARRSQNKFITGTAVRRCVTGDAGSLLRLHKFLMTWGFINGGAFGDSAPSMTGLRQADIPSGEEGPEHGQSVETQTFWTKKRREELAVAVVQESHKRRRLADEGATDGSGTDESSDDVSVDWGAVASNFGGSVGAVDCQRAFLAFPLEDGEGLQVGSEKTVQEKSRAENKMGISSDKMALSNIHSDKKDLFSELLDGIRPEVVKAATDAAMNATEDFSEARKAGLLGAVAGLATERAKEEEAVVGRLLMEVLEARMSKLENRMALTDDVEGMLEAERVALELERRELYTARCRHWFGDGS